MSNTAFFNPTDIGTFDLALTQVDKKMPFTTTEGVFDSSASVELYLGSRCGERTPVVNYALGSGLEITGNNVVGESKTLTLTMSGSDFSSVGRGKTVLADCSLFSQGDVEVRFALLIK